jgi:hypothetical protein
VVVIIIIIILICNALNIVDGEGEVYGIRIGIEGREMVENE